MSLEILPLYIPSLDAAPVDGFALKTSTFCEKKYGEPCKKFYDGINQEGFHRCPYGFAVRAFLFDGKFRFFSSLAIDDISDLKKLRQGTRMPDQLLSKEFVDGCVEQSFGIQAIKNEFSLLHQSNQHLNDAIHEVRNFNTQLKANCEAHAIDTAKTVSHPERTILSNLAISQMITSRLEYLVFYINPSQVKRERISLYKKTDKVIKTIRAEAGLKQVKVEQSGSSFRDMDAFSFIEQVPAIVIQNAIKYATPGTTVKVDVSEGFKSLTLVVENAGPFIHEDEREKVFLKGYRGREAKNVSEGTGTGLWFLQKIVNIHNGSVLLYVGKPILYGGVSTSTIKFEIKLPFE